MADVFDGQSTGMTGPGSYAAAITPGASELAYVPRAIYVGGSGDLVVTMEGGGDVTFPSVPAGIVIPLRVTHILAATTATDIVAIW